jgi:hypothetical protein
LANRPPDDGTDKSSFADEDDEFDDFLKDFELSRRLPPRPLSSREEVVLYCVGVDLGQRRDRTAIAVVEVPYCRSKHAKSYLVKYLKRLPQGLLYADVAVKVKRLDDQLKAEARKRQMLASMTYILDSTGVGEGVSEMRSFSECWEKCNDDK